MRHSEVFDNYIKIAEEKGLTSRDSSKLYDVKTDSIKDMQYKNNIMEIAHKNSKIIKDSYDKINGLVENNIERSNIINRIVQKTPDGLLTQRKYAQKELLLSLVRVANDLDNRKEKKLQKLADSCLEQTSKQIKKEAGLFIPLLVAGLVAGLWAQQHTNDANRGFEQNHNNLVGRINDLIESSVTMGVGYKYRPEFIELLNEFKDVVLEFKDSYDDALPDLNSLQKPRDVNQLVDWGNEKIGENAVDAFRDISHNVANLKPYFDQMYKNITSTSYQKQQILESGGVSNFLESAKLYGGAGLITNEFQDLAKAMVPYRESLEELVAGLKDAEAREAEAKRAIEAYNRGERRDQSKYDRYAPKDMPSASRPSFKRRSDETSGNPGASGPSTPETKLDSGNTAPLSGSNLPGQSR